MLTILVTLGATLFMGGGFALWWLDRLIKNEADLVHDKTAEHLHKLALLGTELHHARAEVTRVHTEVKALRSEMDTFVHGPPSIRSRPQQAS